MSTVTPAAGSRRARLREQTREEIKAAARGQLVAHGPSGIQLRAVARDVGLTAPALYRYFPGLDELVLALTVDLYDELIERMERDRSSQADGTASPDAYQEMLALSRAFRGWAVDHPAEFALLFATPPAGFAQVPDNACQEASGRFGTLFASAFLRMWDQHPFPVDEPDRFAPGLAEGLRPYWQWLTEALAPDIPMGAVVVFLEGWVRIYGIVAMEVFGHLTWAVPDGGPMFEETLRGLARSVGRPDAYLPPAP
jgi:AcrR family transcriptional regulator